MVCEPKRVREHRAPRLAVVFALKVTCMESSELACHRGPHFNWAGPRCDVRGARRSRAAHATLKNLSTQPRLD